MITHFEIKALVGMQLFGVDVAPNNDWIALVGNSSPARTLVSSSQSSPIRCELPFGTTIRFINPKKWLILNGQTKIGENNALIFDLDCPDHSVAFYAGVSIADVLVTNNFIVCTYFDEGVYGDCEVAREGLAAFNHRGEFQHGYKSHFGSEAFAVDDCYAACNTEGDEIAFCAYTGFQLVKWNIAIKSQAGVEIPKILHSPFALTCNGDEFYFHSKYNSRKTIFKYENGNVEKLAGFRCDFRTLRNGRFIDVMQFSFDVVDCTQLMV